MKKYLKIFSFLTFSALLVSCDKDDITTSKESSADIDNLSMTNGKLAFSSKEELAAIINTQKSEGLTFAENSFEKLYQKGFRSHKALVNKDNKQLAARLSEEKNSKVKSGRVDLIKDEHLINDKVFAAFINEDKEIIVGNSLYKFTPRGLFFAKVADSANIRKVATEHNSQTTAKRYAEICDIRELESGITEMEHNVNRYITRIDDNGCGGSGGGGYSGGGSTGGSGSGSTSQSAKNSDIGLNALIQELRICNGGDTNWFQNIFGSYNYCHEYFNDDEFRFELDYWNQDWLVYASVGVEAETHEDGWFWWNNVDSSEIVLGINKVLLRYTAPKPDLSFINSMTSVTTPIYMHDDRFEIKTGNNIYDPVQIKVLNNTRIPFFEFRDEEILNIYIGYNNFYNPLNDANIKQMYKLGAEFLKSKLSTRKDFFVTLQTTNNEIETIYFDQMKRRYNTDEVEIVFAEEWGGLVGVNFSDNGNGFSSSFTAQPASQYFGDYKYINLDIYGLARRGNEWKGVRLIME